MNRNVEELATRFLSSHLSGNTREAYRCDLRSFFSRFGDGDLSGITTEDIASYRDELMKQLKPSTVASKLAVIRHFFRFCVGEGIQGHNPAQSVRSPKVPQYSSTNGLTKEQAESLLRQPDMSALKGKRDYAILCLMLHNGLRNSEVTGIRWGDFSDERGYTVLSICGKGGKECVAKIKPKIMTAIEDYVKASGRKMEPHFPLFIGQKTHAGVRWNRIGKPLAAETIRYMVKRYGRMAGIQKHITPHSLRHTCVTLCLDGGGTIRHAQYLARHADPKTTMRYDRNRNNLNDHGTDYIRLDT